MAHTTEENLLDIAIKREVTSMQQAAEWGLKDSLVYEEKGERRRILTCLSLLFNLCARKVGINQIKAVYLNGLNVDAKVEFVPNLF